MATTIEPVTMTTEQLLAMPEDGIDRDLIRGELREIPMTRRNRRHSRTEASIANALKNWLHSQPMPRGEVLSGEAGFRLRRDPDTTVGIDVAYISAEMAAATPDSAFLVEGPPVLAVEVLSPSDTHEDVSEKVTEYLEAGTNLVWVVDPAFRTVIVYEPRREPVLFNVTQALDGGSHLPGFHVQVAALFS
jgi:Uma2 family endonuclease